ncbi:DUF2125 domain-containing protein [Polycladidibacter stylochi]|uniref:DUF2125 domain-containing protein n=1 Tax=Polycladidibacter stylochi TaxID=1807766 RepID=UPI00083324E4|nr:DUF2125 domain-containing protein [Pseudovibrio stylochi]
MGHVNTTAKKSTKKYYILAGIIAFIAFAWAMVWDFGRGAIRDFLRNGIAVAAQQGTNINCGAQDISGFPWKFELNCTPLIIDSKDIKLDLSQLTATALAYNPGHIIVALHSPFSTSIAHAGTTITANWQEALTSARATTEGITQLDIDINRLKAKITTSDLPIHFSVASGEVHLRETKNEQDLEAAIVANAARLDVLPFNSPMDITSRIVLKSGANIIKNKPSSLEALLQHGPLTFVIKQLNAKVDGVSFKTSTALRLNPNGYLEGDLPLTVTGAQNLSNLLEPLFPSGSSLPSTIQAAAMAIGTTDSNGQVTANLPISYRKNRVYLGFIDLGPQQKLL